MQVLNNGAYFISFKGFESKSLTVSEEHLNDENVIYNKILMKNANQCFIIKYKDITDNYTITPLNSHRFLGVLKNNESNYIFSLITNCSSSTKYNMVWKIELSNDNYYSIESEGTDLRLEYDKQTDSVQLGTKSNNDNQKVLIKPLQIIENGFYAINTKFDSNFALSFSNQKSFVFKQKNEKKSQIFWIQFDANDGCYSMINAENDHCFSVDKDLSHSFFNHDSQKWIISPSDSSENDFFIELKSNLQRLEVQQNSESKFLAFKMASFDEKATENSCQLFQFQKAKLNDEKRKEEILSLIKKAEDSKKIKLNSEFTEINDDAFANGPFIESIELPLSISKITEKAFERCTNVKAISCDPKWLKLLSNPLNVKHVIVPEGVERIERSCFSNLRNLKYLSLPKYLKTIDPSSFANLYNINVFEGDPKFLVHIYKMSLIRVIIPEYVVDIPEETFAGCKNLKKVVFKGDSKLKTIQSRAFANCESLEPFSIPKSVDNISSDAFYGCNEPNLKIEINEERQKQSMTDNLIIDEKVTKVTKDYEVYCNIESLEIPLTTTEFEDDVFQSFKKLKYVKCNPNLINYFHSPTIKFVFIPDKIKQINKEDFDQLVNLKFVEIPESVDNIEANAFESCTNLTTIKCGTKHLHYLDKKKIKTLILNNEVKQISRSDFDELINLENCELPESIKINDKDIFINCKKLIRINNSYAQSLINNKISIKDGIKSISKQQFEGWTNLIFLAIPKTVENIEDGTFDDCKNLESLICDPKWFPLIPKTKIKELKIPDYATELNKEQFDGFYSLTKLELPNDIKINDPCIFDTCESLSCIKCNNSIYEMLSNKSQKLCLNNQKNDYIKPAYQFICSNNACVNDQNSIEQTIETSIDDLADFDKNNNKYCHSIMNVRGFTHSGKVPKDYKPENSELPEISKVCGSVCHEIFTKFGIIPKTPQYLTILRLADEILNNESHGSIAKMNAGEGKTFVVTVLSIVLFKYGRTIDIVISNLELAKRKQKEQKRYFDLFDIETGVLYEKCDNQTFSEKSISNDILKCPVVYSTLENFESIYLRSLFSIKMVKRPFDVVLVDEIDKMLNDEFYSPLAITTEINYAFSRDIYEIVFLLHCWKTSEIVKVLNYFFPNSGTFEEEEIFKLKNAAISAINMTKKVDYLIINGQINCINSGIQWNEHVYRMIEIKESLEPNPSLVTSCQVDHHSYLNFYNKIAGVTGSFGSTGDEELLKKGYKINIFTVLPQVLPQLKVTTKNRPLRKNDLYDSLMNEIIEEREKGRPILIVFDTIHHADSFTKSKPFLLAQRILGENPDLDNFAIENAGNQGAVTVATIDAISGIDIKLSDEVLEAGGLHVIVPMKMPNQRMLEQAAGRSGRHGQAGSVTFYISGNDEFKLSKEFSKDGEILAKVELDFANYIKDNFPWILVETCGLNFSQNVYPFGTSPPFILEILSRQIVLINKSCSLYGSANELEKLFSQMIQLSWSLFFSNIKGNTDNYKEKYSNFIKELNIWLHPTKSKTCKDAFDYIRSKLSNEDDLDYFNYKGTNIHDCNINFIFTEKAPEIKLMNGTLLSGGEEVYHQLQIGTKINWYQILSAFCDYPLMNLINIKWILKSKNIDIESSSSQVDVKEEANGLKEEDDYEDEIVTLKCEQKDTWEWIFYNIKDKKKKKPKKLLKSTAIPPFLTIDFVRKALNLSGEAYTGVFSIGKIIHSCEENDTFKPVFYCLEDSETLYVITRGSYSKHDWMTDFDCKEVKCEINGTSIYFHQGFYNSANYVLNSISSILDQDYKTIFFIGHSYGASVSAVLCLLTKSQAKFSEKNIFALAFGSAPSMSFCPPEIENRIFTFINGDDLIPSFCLFNTLNTAMKNHLSFQLFVKLCLLILKPINNKWIKEFVYAIEQNFEIITDVIGILNVKKVKGIVFKIGENNKKKLSDCIIDETQLPNMLSISLTSLFNHFVDEYEKSFKVIQS